MQLPDRASQSDSGVFTCDWYPGVFTCDGCGQRMRNTEEDKARHEESRVHRDAVAFWSDAAAAAEEA